MANQVALEGKHHVLLFRLLEKASTEEGAKLAFQTDHSESYKANSSTTITKDGPIISVGSPETEYSLNCIASKGGTLLTDLEDALMNNKVVEVWNPQIDPATLTPDAPSKHPGAYAQGYITDISKSSPAEDYVKVSMTFKVNQIPQKGDVTVSAAQAQAIQYAFTDTPAAPAEPTVP